jgi:hypothetical protein
LGRVGLGIGVAGFHAGSALSAPRFGRLVERVGPARCVELTAGLAALCSLAIAVGARSATAMSDHRPTAQRMPSAMSRRW